MASQTGIYRVYYRQSETSTLCVLLTIAKCEVAAMQRVAEALGSFGETVIVYGATRVASRKE